VPKILGTLLAATVLLLPCISRGEPVRVRHIEGLVHGFLVLRTLHGVTLARGDLIQRARGTHVTSRLVFRFKDGSLHDETAIYTQRQTFRLVTYRLLQRGPSFPRRLDMSIDAVKGNVTVRYTDDDGEQKVESEHLDLPPDLANGLVSTLLKNVRAGVLPVTVGYVAATPKPRLVKLEMTAAGQESFSTGGLSRKATHYVLKVEIGGLAGVVAGLIGKKPPDSHVWILADEAPAFVKSEQPFYDGGPMWRIELVSPVWAQKAREKK
jgi:hypothetical protein